MTESAIKASSQQTEIITLLKHLKTINLRSYLINNNNLELIYQANSEIQLLNNIKKYIQFLFMYKCDWILQNRPLAHIKILLHINATMKCPHLART